MWILNRLTRLLRRRKPSPDCRVAFCQEQNFGGFPTQPRWHPLSTCDAVPMEPSQEIKPDRERKAPIQTEIS